MKNTIKNFIAQKVKHEKNPKKKLNAITLLIMDQSGSMLPILGAVEESYQGIVGSIKNEITTMPQLDQFVSLWQFGNDRVREALPFKQILEAEEVPKVDFIANGSTPLLDAIGHSLQKLETEMIQRNMNEKNTIVSVAIFTDGEENSSREFQLSEITRTIDKLTLRGWKFQYFGTDHDVLSAAQKLNIKEVVSFAKNAKEFKQVGEKFAGNYAMSKESFMKSWLSDAEDFQ